MTSQRHLDTSAVESKQTTVILLYVRNEHNELKPLRQRKKKHENESRVWERKVCEEKKNPRKKLRRLCN